MPSYETLRKHQSELIRKALKGSFFIAPDTAQPVTALTTSVAGPPAVISLTALPTGWADLGLLTADGVGMSGDQSSSDVTSWGYTTPTRSDIISDTTSLTVVAQETNVLTLGLYTGADMAATKANLASGELRIDKPARPSSRYYRGLLVAVDESEAGEVYIGRYFPRIKVTGKADQNFGGGDDPITWGVTFQTYVDDATGSSESYLFGGPGWKADLTKMGIVSATA